MLKPLVSKFRSHLKVRLRDIALKRVPDLKPIVDASNAHMEEFRELTPISPSEPPVPAVNLRDSPPKLQLHRSSHGSARGSIYRQSR